MLKRMDAIERPLPVRKQHAKAKVVESDDDSEIEVDTSPGGRVMKKDDGSP